ncbi:MAG: T9SS type A sorting domain-containing protein [Candidatus Marinimicrobia bacterium]|nr:T9SS type A sorting domain-containing protein [Candidatus Neomarinimicrobiota bacterium]
MDSRKSFLIAITVFTFFTVIIAYEVEVDTLTVMTYNILNFDSYSTDRVANFNKIIEEVNPDILVVQELKSASGGQLFLNNVMNAGGDEYSATPFIDGPYTDNQLFYRNSIILHVKTEQIHTDLRDISAYTLGLNNYSDTSFKFIIYTVHLKASQGSEEENRRYIEVLKLKEHADYHYLETHYIVAGDLNVYNANEPAYKVLIDSMAIDLFDPIDSPGNWHNSGSFAWLHTQATRENYNGWNYGGLDDRFDFILMSEPFHTSDGLQYVSGSYKAYGNDGNHFNNSINDGVNTAVSTDLADALYYASDHLPVVAKVCYSTSNSESMDETYLPDELQLLVAYPNPFNQSVNFKVEVPEQGNYNISVFDLTGNLIWSNNFQSHDRTVYTLSWDGTNKYNRPLSSGIYIVKVVGLSYNQKIKVILLK